MEPAIHFGPRESEVRGWERQRPLHCADPGDCPPRAFRDQRAPQPSKPAKPGKGSGGRGRGGSSHCNRSFAGERSVFMELAGIRAMVLDCPPPALHLPRTRVQIPVLRGSCLSSLAAAWSWGLGEGWEDPPSPLLRAHLWHCSM